MVTAVSNSTPNPSSCSWRCSRVELAVIISAVALAVLGLGLSATTLHSAAYISLGGAGALVLAELVYKAVRCFKPKDASDSEKERSVSSGLSEDDWALLPNPAYSSAPQGRGLAWYNPKRWIWG